MPPPCPDSTSNLYVDRKSALLMDRKSAHPPTEKIEHHCRVPDSVLRDKELTDAAKNVYAYLAGLAINTTVVTRGTRTIASKTCLARSTVRIGIAQLVARGHITVVSSGRRTNSYHLTSNIFTQVFHKGQRELVAGPSGHVRAVCLGEGDDSVQIPKKSKRRA